MKQLYLYTEVIRLAEQIMNDNPNPVSIQMGEMKVTISYSSNSWADTYSFNIEKSFVDQEEQQDRWL